MNTDETTNQRNRAQWSKSVCAFAFFTYVVLGLVCLTILFAPSQGWPAALLFFGFVYVFFVVVWLIGPIARRESVFERLLCRRQNFWECTALILFCAAILLGSYFNVQLSMYRSLAAAVMVFLVSAVAMGYILRRIGNRETEAHQTQVATPDERNYATIYVHGPESIDDLRTRVRQFDRELRVGISAFETRLAPGDSYAEAGGDFIMYPYRIEFDPGEYGRSRLEAIQALTSFVRSLKALGYAVVPACDYEDALPDDVRWRENAS